MCSDVNECLTNNGGCNSAQTCTNTPGSRTCGNCPAGYTNNGGGCAGLHWLEIQQILIFSAVLISCRYGTHLCIPSCLDVNECLTSNGGCDSRRACTNTQGSRTCGNCAAGWTNSGPTGCTGLGRLVVAGGNSKCIHTQLLA